MLEKNPAGKNRKSSSENIGGLVAKTVGRKKERTWLATMKPLRRRHRQEGGV